jgi:membrane peptidoglycan carboxypeptidase
MVPDDPISVPNGSAGVPKWIANYDGIFKGPIPIREALAQSRNAVAIWLTSHIGIAAVLRMSERVGIRTPLHPYATTALGASEVTLLELATVYRTIASGVLARPHVIQRVVLISGDVIPGGQSVPEAVDLETGTLALIQEGLRGVVRLPTGTAHALDSRAFPVAVMGKTGTTNGFRDALFVGSTYGVGGVTVAVRIGFDDARSLGLRETGSRAALPVFQEVILRLYQSQIVGLPPPFPPQMERRITRYVTGDGTPDAADATSTVAAARDDTIKATPSRAAARKRMVGSTSAP